MQSKGKTNSGWGHAMFKKIHAGNYEYQFVGAYRVLRLEHRKAKGITVGKVYIFRSWQAAKKAGWFKI